VLLPDVYFYWYRSGYRSGIAEDCHTDITTHCFFPLHSSRPLLSFRLPADQYGKQGNFSLQQTLPLSGSVRSRFEDKGSDRITGNSPFHHQLQADGGRDNIKEGAKTESGQNRKEVMSAEMRSFLVLRIGQQVNETIIEDGSYVKRKNSEW
jgi:hypothetical protein